MTKMFQTTSRAALIALLAASPLALTAQEAEMTPEAEATAPLPTEGAEAGAETTAEAPLPSEEAAPEVAEGEAETGPVSPETEMAEGEAMPMEGEDPMGAPEMGTEMTAEAEPEAQPVEGQITMQDMSTILAADLIGATVYNAGEESVGDIADLIVSMDGQVEGVVIGVGGFLGMGEKAVAIEMAMLEVGEDASGNPRLITSATKADLEAAPEFVTKQEQMRAEEQAEMQMNAEPMGEPAAPIQ